MKKVYVVMERVTYEGSDVAAIFDTQEKAKTFIHELLTREFADSTVRWVSGEGLKGARLVFPKETASVRIEKSDVSYAVEEWEIL